MNPDCYKKYRLLSVFCFLLFVKTGAQSHSFSNLNTSNGLSENNVQSVAIDKKGFLWIGTIDGLNMYDGYSITTYKKETQPEIANNNIIHMTCDSRNRIWLGTHDGITWIDENRQFHREDKDVIPAPPPPPTPIPVPETKPVQGTWMGNRYGMDKSVPYYFGFDIKAQGKLNVLNQDKQVIGTGGWNFDNDVFTATYIITSSGITYSVRNDFFDKPDKIGGTWGFDNNDSNGGTWKMNKIN